MKTIYSLLAVVAGTALVSCGWMGGVAAQTPTPPLIVPNVPPPPSSTGRVDTLEQKVELMEKQIKALRDANYAIKNPPVGAAAPFTIIPPCDCGCMETGDCGCKNCCKRTKSPAWQANEKAKAAAERKKAYEEFVLKMSFINTRNGKLGDTQGYFTVGPVDLYAGDMPHFRMDTGFGSMADGIYEVFPAAGGKAMFRVMTVKQPMPPQQPMGFSPFNPAQRR